MGTICVLLAVTAVGGMAPLDFDAQDIGPSALTMDEADGLSLREMDAPELVSFEGGSHGVVLLVLLLLLLCGGGYWCCC